MTRHRRSITTVLTAVLILGLTGLVFAAADTTRAPKDSAPNRIRETGPGGLQLLTEEDRQADDQRMIRVAREMIRQRNYEGASGLLESVYQRDNTNTVVMNLLRMCYEQMGRPAQAELVIRRLIDITPRSYILQVFLAESLIHQGDTTGAAETYSKALELIPREDPNLYRQVVRSMRETGMTDRGLAVLDSLRTETGQPDLLAFEAGQYYEGERQYRQAAEEYYAATADTSRMGTEAESKLQTLLEFAESADIVEPVLRAHTDDSTAPRAAHLLSMHYMKANRMDEAMQFALLEDSLHGNNGISLYQFMQTCHDRELYDQVAEVGQVLMERYGSSPVMAQSRFVYAEALKNLGEYAQAKAVYDEIIRTYPRVQDRSEAGYEIGEMYLNDLLDYDSALVMFDSVASTHQGGLGYFHSMLAAPEALTRMDKLDSARTLLEKLSDRRLNEDYAEEVAFRLGKLSLYEKKFDTARAELNKLMVDYPRGYYVNDALKLIMAIDDASGADQVLYDYSNALLFEQQRRFDSAAARYEVIAGGMNPLADLALYRLTEMSLERDFDSTAALNYISQLGERFPDSYYLPFGLKLKGEMFLSDPDRREEGREIYRDLLKTYPNYPFISEVRAKLREIEVDARIG